MRNLIMLFTSLFATNNFIANAQESDKAARTKGINFIETQATHPEPKTLEIGSKAPDFNLPGVDGKTYSLKDFDKASVLVVIFSCNHCPTAQAYEDRIISLANDYKSKRVDLVMISPNSVKALNYSELGYTDMGDSYEEMKLRAADKKFTFPYLYDGDDQKTALVVRSGCHTSLFCF